jgi:hypothetical protein
MIMQVYYLCLEIFQLYLLWPNIARVQPNKKFAAAFVYRCQQILPTFVYILIKWLSRVCYYIIFLCSSVLGRPATRQEVSSSAELWAAPPPLNTYEGGRIFCLDLFVKGQFICDVQ